MALGACQYITCDRMLGSSFRAVFHHLDGSALFTEVLLCPTHCRESEVVRDKGPGKMMMSEEGWVYHSIWLDAFGFCS